VGKGPGRTETVEFGKHKLRIMQDGSGWTGIVVGNSSERIHADSRAELIRKLEAAAGRDAPEFIGLAGARTRFLQLFPRGFEDRNFIGDAGSGEAYKRAFAARVAAELPLDDWQDLEDSAKRARRLFTGINLIDPYTKTAIGNVLKSDRAESFLAICSDFARGDVARACGDLTRHFGADGVAKWTAITFLPFFWRPADHMFLKPEFTREFARRIGHPFEVHYNSTPNPECYARLLDMAQQTSQRLADLGPRDMIDIHSFMWATIQYRDSDVA